MITFRSMPSTMWSWHVSAWSGSGWLWTRRPTLGRRWTLTQMGRGRTSLRCYMMVSYSPGEKGAWKASLITCWILRYLVDSLELSAFQFVIHCKLGVPVKPVWQIVSHVLPVSVIPLNTSTYLKKEKWIFWSLTFFFILVHFNSCTCTLIWIISIN